MTERRRGTAGYLFSCFTVEMMNGDDDDEEDDENGDEDYEGGEDV